MRFKASCSRSICGLSSAWRLSMTMCLASCSDVINCESGQLAMAFESCSLIWNAFWSCDTNKFCLRNCSWNLTFKASNCLPLFVMSSRHSAYAFWTCSNSFSITATTLWSASSSFAVAKAEFRDGLMPLEWSSVTMQCWRAAMPGRSGAVHGLTRTYCSSVSVRWRNSPQVVICLSVVCSSAVLAVLAVLALLSAWSLCATSLSMDNLNLRTLMTAGQKVWISARTASSLESVWPLYQHDGA